MCIKLNGDDFTTIHHELGHNYYLPAYNKYSYLHEAIGDAIAVAITPEYPGQIGLVDADKMPSADKDIGLLLRQAMD